jgi:glycosyltransferase involved in cell wall biosynthesis
VAISPGRRPRVSVIIACFNYGRFVTAAVQSALSQQGVGVDVVVIDDASLDESPDVLRELGSDARVQIITHHVNQGYITAYNNGFRRVLGEYVVKLDADDVLLPGALERAVAVLDSDPGLTFVYGRPVHFEFDSPRSDSGRPWDWTSWTGHDWLELRCQRATNCISNPEVVMRATALKRVGGFQPQLTHSCDLDLWMRLSAIGDVGRINRVAHAGYRVHPASMQRTVNAGRLADLIGRRDAFDSVFSHQGAILADAEALHALARRRLAVEALTWACWAFDRGRTATEPIEGYCSFAVETWPDAKSLGQWHGLLARRRLGPAFSRVFPPFVAQTVARRVGHEYAKRRWARSGV